MAVADNEIWTVDREIQLFQAIRHHKPVGVNRYFQMVLLAEKMLSLSGKPIRTEQIWNHLKTMYDLNALNNSDSTPFPNDETDFVLPESSDFTDLKEREYPRSSNISQTEDESDLNKSTSSETRSRGRDRDRDRDSKSEKRSDTDRSSERHRSASGSTGQSKDSKSVKDSSRDTRSEKSDQSRDRSESRGSDRRSSVPANRKRTRQTDANEKKEEPVPLKRGRPSRT